TPRRPTLKVGRRRSPTSASSHNPGRDSDFEGISLGFIVRQARVRRQPPCLSPRRPAKPRSYCRPAEGHTGQFKRCTGSGAEGPNDHCAICRARQSYVSKRKARRSGGEGHVEERSCEMGEADQERRHLCFPLALRQCRRSNLVSSRTSASKKAVYLPQTWPTRCCSGPFGPNR